MNFNVKTGSRKGRPNDDAGFKRQFAMASCQAGVSIARMALEHGINANMLHKWQREYLAAPAAQAHVVHAQFLPVMVAQVDAEILDQPAHIPAHRAVKRPSSKPPAPVTGVIEIKFGGAPVHIEGASGMRNECTGDQYETRR